jgi:hypothetical protein
MNLTIIKDVAVRIVALFVTSALGIITGSSVIQSFSTVTVPVWFQALQAGGASVAMVVFELAKSMQDGKLTKAEVDQAFGIKEGSRNAS